MRLGDDETFARFGRPSERSDMTDGVGADVVVFGMEDEAKSFSVDEENLGFRVAFQEANARGSIHGRSIAWRGYLRGGGASASDALEANFNRLIADKVFALVNFAGGDATHRLVKASRDARIPYLFPHSGLVSSAGERYLFASYPNLESEALIMFHFLAKERGAKRIAIAHDPNIYGMFYVERLQRYAERFGYDYAGGAPIDTRTPGDLTDLLRGLIENRPDAIFMGLYPAQAKAVMEAKAKLGWTGVMVSSGPLTDEQYLNLPDGRAEGTLGFCYYADPNIGEEAGLASYRAAITRFASDHSFNRYSLYGYVFGKLIVEGLDRAGRDLTRESFIDAMETIADWDAGGVMPDVTLSKTNHHAQPAGFVGELRHGRFSRLSDWVVA